MNNGDKVKLLADVYDIRTEYKFIAGGVFDIEYVEGDTAYITDYNSVAMCSVNIIEAI